MISRVWSSCLQGSQSCRKLDPRKRTYRGIVTADVLVQGLSRGAIAARKLQGVNRDKEYEGYTGSAPYGEGKSLRPVEVVLITVSMTRELNRYARLSICCHSS